MLIKACEYYREYLATTPVLSWCLLCISRPLKRSTNRLVVHSRRLSLPRPSGSALGHIGLSILPLACKKISRYHHLFKAHANHPCLIADCHRDRALHKSCSGINEGGPGVARGGNAE